MRGYRLRIAFCALAFLLLAVSAYAEGQQYWFQFGARGGPEAYFNNGASVSIKTIVGQNPGSGSLAFWVGENLQNGAFLQIGYLVENQSGEYPTECGESGCVGQEYLNAGQPVWFYEYFPRGYNSSFLGAIGPVGSVGGNGTVNNYGFYSAGDEWYFLLNGNTIGKVNLGTSSSGPNDPVAFGEVADSNGSVSYIKPVLFSNLTKYTNGNFLTLGKGYAYVGYGVGSSSGLPNPFGVEEIDGRSDYFIAGSDLPQSSNNQVLWNFGYMLAVFSKYGNLNTSGIYQPYHTIDLSAPQFVYIGNLTREEFDGWQGQGKGSYSGSQENTTILLYGNVSETADWLTQYFVGISSPYSSIYGTGWYNSNSTANYSVGTNTVQVNASERYVFAEWNNGNLNTSGQLYVSNYIALNAIWATEYFVNANADYGNTSGTGWYPANSYATLAVLSPVSNISSDEKYAFYSWSDGNRSTVDTVRVLKPMSLSADYKYQYLVHFRATNIYGQYVNVSGFNVDNTSVGNETFLFSGDNYYVNGAQYRGQMLSFSSLASATAPANISVALPLYNVVIRTLDVFGGPVDANATLEYSNGTIVGYNSGPNGTIVLRNVPYGQVRGVVKYLGLSETVSTQGNADVRYTFVSVVDLVVFAVALIFSAAFYEIARRKLSEPAKDDGKAKGRV